MQRKQIDQPDGVFVDGGGRVRMQPTAAIKTLLSVLGFAQMGAFMRKKAVDKRTKTAYNKPVKRKIAMKGPMPPLRFSERKPLGVRLSA